MSRKNQTRTVSIAISEKETVHVPQSVLSAAASRGILDQTSVARAYKAHVGGLARTALQLDDPSYWALLRDALVARAKCQREARAQDRDARIQDTVAEKLAVARALLGLSESDRALLGRKAEKSSRSSKASKDSTPVLAPLAPETQDSVQ